MSPKLERLKQSLSKNELSHALILELASSALPQIEDFFRTILCLEGKGRACLRCESCLISLNLGGSERKHPDFFLAQPQSESGYSVEQVRDWESRFLYLSRNLSPRKLLVVTEAEKLCGGQNAAANSLLKVLEEPRPFTHIILATHSALRLLPTLRSRCLKIHLAGTFSGAVARSDSFCEIAEALRGRFGKNSELSNPSWWKDRAARISEIEGALPGLWKEFSAELASSERELGLKLWSRWKHFEDFVRVLGQYGNPSLHWLNFKRKVLMAQKWRMSRLFG